MNVIHDNTTEENANIELIEIEYLEEEINKKCHQQLTSRLFYICIVKAKKQNKYRCCKHMYTELHIPLTNNFLLTRVDTAADVNLMSLDVYKNIYKD